MHACRAGAAPTTAVCADDRSDSGAGIAATAARRCIAGCRFNRAAGDEQRQRSDALRHTAIQRGSSAWPAVAPCRTTDKALASTTPCRGGRKAAPVSCELDRNDARDACCGGITCRVRVNSSRTCRTAAGGRGNTAACRGRLQAPHALYCAHY